MSQKNYFFCYNKKVSDHLKDSGIEWITVAKDPKTNKIFSLYVINEDLQQALDEYKNLR